MESDKTFEGGVGMRLDLEHKTTLTIGVDDLVISGTDPAESTRGRRLSNEE